MIRVCGFVGHIALGTLAEAGRVAYLLRDVVWWIFVAPFRGAKSRRVDTFVQMERVGFRSLPVVSLVLMFIGIILALQMAHILKTFGVMEYVGIVVGVSMIRELGPLLTALVMSGYIGAAIAAELGTMTVSEEIMALETSGTNPVRFLVVPRLIGTMVMLPCITLIGDLVGILGGMIVAVGALQMDAALYISKTYEKLVAADIATGVVKSMAFAAVIAVVSCREGLKTTGGAEGVGRSTTAAVVNSMVFIIIVDCVLTALFYMI